MRGVFAFLGAVLIGLAPAGATSDVAETEGIILLELNDLAAVEDACRASFVVVNGLDQAIDDLSFDIVVFDTNETVRMILTLQAGALPAGKTRVRQFDLPQIGCDTISRILMNDVITCAGDGLDPSVCLGKTMVESRHSVGFVL